MSRTLEQRWSLIVITVGAISLGLLWVTLGSVGSEIISAALEGRFLSGLGRSIRVHMTNNPDHAEVEYYVQLASAAVGRALLLWIACGSVLVILQRSHKNLLTDFFRADGDALTLGVTRLVVFSILALSVNVDAVVRLAAQPSGMIQAPRFMGWFVQAFPISPVIAAWTARLLIGSSVLAALGFLTRYSTAASVLLAVYVFGLPQYFGKISHGLHGLVWIAMILALSPSGSVFSIDSRLNPGTTERRGRIFGLPIRLIWFLFACIYFFPGALKFIISGWDWALSDNLKFKMYSTWLGGDFVPALRIDHYSVLYRGGALFTMLWEIAFPFLILFRRSRLAALACGVIFHVGVWEFMRIGPPLILFGYVAFVDWDALAAQLRGASPAPRIDRGATQTVRIIGSAVCGLVFLAGLTLTDSWPFSVYPTHAGMRGPTYQKLDVIAETPAGDSAPIESESLVPITSQSIDFAVFAARDTIQRNAFLKGLAENWASNADPPDSTTLHFYRSVRLLDPDAPDGEPLTREHLLTLTIHQARVVDPTTHR